MSLLLLIACIDIADKEGAMRITVEKPHSDISYYLAIQEGPLRTIIVEGDNYPEVFVGVLTQIAEQGRELAEARQ